MGHSCPMSSHFPGRSTVSPLAVTRRNLGIDCASTINATHMNATNPFQIPTAYQIELENRRRNRVKKTVMIAIGATTALLVGLLIEGCVSEHSKSAAAPSPSQAIADQPAASTVAAAHTPSSIPQPTSAVKPAAVVPPPATTAAVKTAETIYVVKSGDTLSKIAKSHGVSIKALKSANDLASDHIVVGAKLKMPQV